MNPTERGVFIGYLRALSASFPPLPAMVGGPRGGGSRLPQEDRRQLRRMRNDVMGYLYSKYADVMP